MSDVAKIHPIAFIGVCHEEMNEIRGVVEVIYIYLHSEKCLADEAFLRSILSVLYYSDRRIRPQFVSGPHNHQVSRFQVSEYFREVVFGQPRLNVDPLRLVVPDANYKRMLQVGSYRRARHDKTRAGSLDGPLHLRVGPSRQQTITVEYVEFNRHGSGL